MAKSKKAMSKSLKSTGDAWRAHVANVAKQENVKYGKAMSLASKGKYGAEWKKIKAGMGSSKKAASAAVGGGDANPYNEPNMNGGEPLPAEEGIGKNAEPSAMSGGRRRRTRKAKGRKGKRGGGALGLVL